MDEAQSFVTSRDHEFLATCRSSKVANVLLTQNLGSLEAALGGDRKGEAQARTLIGNLNTKVFCANGDHPTNQWAADLLGKEPQLMMSGNESHQNEASLQALMGLDQPGQTSAGFSETIDFRVQPADFAALRTGGPTNGFCVDAILFKTGASFPSTGAPYAAVSFRQGG
jgi:hypothetical protein